MKKYSDEFDSFLCLFYNSYPLNACQLLVHGLLRVYSRCAVPRSSCYCLRDRSLKLSSRMDLLLRRNFLWWCWYHTTPPRTRAMSRRMTPMAIKTEVSISISFIGICMPSIFTLPSPMSLGIATEMEQEENGNHGLESTPEDIFYNQLWKRRNKLIQVGQKNGTYTSKDQPMMIDSVVIGNQCNKMP